MENNQEQKKALIDLPMSAEEFLQKKVNHCHTAVAMEAYANYLSKYHVEKASELIAERAITKLQTYRHLLNTCLFGLILSYRFHSVLVVVNRFDRYYLHHRR